MARIPIKLTIELPAEAEFDLATALAVLSGPAQAPAKEVAKAPAKEVVKAPAKEVAKAPAKEVVKAPAKEVARLMKASQVAEMTGLSVYTIYEYAQRGILPAIKMGQRRIYFDRTAVDNWIKGLSVKYVVNNH